MLPAVAPGRCSSFAPVVRCSAAPGCWSRLYPPLLPIRTTKKTTRKKTEKKQKKTEKKQKKNKELTKTPRELRRPRCPVLRPPLLPVVGPPGFRPSRLRASPSAGLPVCGPSRLRAFPVVGLPGFGPSQLWAFSFVGHPVRGPLRFRVLRFGLPGCCSVVVFSRRLSGPPFLADSRCVFSTARRALPAPFSAGARSVLDERMSAARCVG